MGKYDGNPVLWIERDWEVRETGIFHSKGSIHHGDDGFELWYTVFDRALESVLLCYARSDDGLKWEKPDIGLVEYRGTSANNVLQRTTPGNDFFTVWKHPHTGTYWRLSTYERPDGDGGWELS